VDGSDMNVKSAWQRGYTGKGVVVTILDDGIQTNHPDLVSICFSMYFPWGGIFLMKLHHKGNFFPMKNLIKSFLEHL